jgi:hypothetical protein
MIGRRKFLKVLGVGTAAAPLAARAAAEDAAKSLTMRGSDASPLAANIAPGGWAMPGQPALHAGEPNEFLSFIRCHGRIPDHVERRHREQAQWVHYLDPDIACKRSWSLNVKIQEQRQRNYHRAIDQMMDYNWYNNAQKKFAETFGFAWPW